MSKKETSNLHLNILARNIDSYSHVLNKPSDMVLINEYKQIYYVLASIQNNKDRDKEDGKQNNKEAGGQKTKNKSASAGEEEKKKHELMSGMR